MSLGFDGARAAACDRLVPEAELIALPSLQAVVEATVRGDVFLGVRPLESLLSYRVAETHDLLFVGPGRERKLAAAFGGPAPPALRRRRAGALRVPARPVDAELDR